MYKQLKLLLVEAGLTESEVIVYLELLRKPSLSKWELVIRTGFDKNQIYRAFDRLNSLKMVEKNESGIEALSLDYLLADLEASQKKTQHLASKIGKFSPFLKLPTEAISDFRILDTKEKILDKYIMMSEVKYDTCLDFGDLEKFVPVVGGLDSIFKFRENRFNQNAKNRAICTTIGPYTSCMARKSDMDKFKSNIEMLKIDFKDKWIIFSDTNDYMMFNYFSDKKGSSSVLVKSKVIADTQRAQFDQFYKNLEKF